MAALLVFRSSGMARRDANFDAFDAPSMQTEDVVDASRLHVLCRAGRVESLFDSAPALVPVVSDSDDDDDEAAFLAAASGALDE